MWLFLMRWGGLPEMVVNARYSRADPHPVPPWEWRKKVKMESSRPDQPPVVRPPFKFLHADTLSGAKIRVSGAGGRYPSARCGRCVL